MKFLRRDRPIPLEGCTHKYQLLGRNLLARGNCILDQANTCFLKPDAENCLELKSTCMLCFKPVRFTGDSQGDIRIHTPDDGSDFKEKVEALQRDKIEGFATRYVCSVYHVTTMDNWGVKLELVECIGRIAHTVSGTHALAEAEAFRLGDEMANMILYEET